MVTIIVPAYNAEAYLDSCVSSIFSQSESDWELLLVDDGSTDETGAICERYSAQDSRIRTIHRKHSGVSAARNVGIDEAQGDYLTFLDADDVFAPTFLEETLRAIRETGAEMAGTDHILFSGKGPEWGSGSRENTKRVELSPREAIMGAMYQRETGNTGKLLDCSACGNLYARRLWEGQRFREGRRYEDLDIFYRVWERANKIIFLPEGLMGYRQHSGSFVHTASEQRADALDATDRMVRYYEERGDDGLLRAARTRRFAAHWNVLLLLRRHKIDNSELRERCLRVLTESRGDVARNGSARVKDRVGALAAYLLRKPKRGNGG